LRTKPNKPVLFRQVTIPREYTVLNPGRYTDALQVVAGVSKDVFWIGQIVVVASPFAGWA
jgi:hypothetical protein